MAFYGLKSKITNLEEQLKLAKEENKRLIEERERAEISEVKYRNKQKRAKDNLENQKKKATKSQKELIVLNIEHDKLKEAYENLEEEYASDLEHCQIQMEKKDKTIKFLKKELYERSKSLKTYKNIQNEIEKNKLMLQSYHMQLQEKAKTDKLRETLMKTNFQQQVREALILGQEQGRVAERQRQKKREADTWKKLLEDEEEFTQTEREARMSAAHVVASELNGHVASKFLSSTIADGQNSNPIYFMDKFNDRMEEANLLLQRNTPQKQSKTANLDDNNDKNGAVVMDKIETKRNFDHLVSRLKNMNHVYFMEQNYNAEKDLKIKMTAQDIS